MKKITFVFPLLLITVCHAQNVGIGTTSPAYPLSFSNGLGNKISLYGNGGAHYGLGLQSGLFQMYSDAPNANIAFGYGSSTAFTERMKLYNSGPDALLLQGRVSLRNGTIPVNTDYGPGIWLARADNAANLGFMGTQNNQNIGFYGGPGGWGFTYDAINSRVGIGNQTPNAPLSFPALLGRKITLYPGAVGNVGLGVYGNELRIHTDYQAADITFGFENTSGVFTERMRVKGNGQLAFDGNAGAPGQVLVNNATGTPQWLDIMPKTYTSIMTDNFTWSIDAGTSIPLPGLSLTLNITKPSRVNISASINQFISDCFACSQDRRFSLLENGVTVRNVFYSGGDEAAFMTLPNAYRELAPGTYTYTIRIGRNSQTFAMSYYGGINGTNSSYITAQVFPNF